MWINSLFKYWRQSKTGSNQPKIKLHLPLCQGLKLARRVKAALWKDPGRCGAWGWKRLKLGWIIFTKNPSETEFDDASDGVNLWSHSEMASNISFYQNFPKSYQERLVSHSALGLDWALSFLQSQRCSCSANIKSCCSHTDVSTKMLPESLFHKETPKIPLARENQVLQTRQNLFNMRVFSNQAKTTEQKMHQTNARWGNLHNRFFPAWVKSLSTQCLQCFTLTQSTQI